MRFISKIADRLHSGIFSCLMLYDLCVRKFGPFVIFLVAQSYPWFLSEKQLVEVDRIRIFTLLSSIIS